MDNSHVNVRWVAEQAGVSPATVSRVSRGSTQVSPELRERVLRVIEEHGYRPNHFGRALAEKPPRRAGPGLPRSVRPLLLRADPGLRGGGARDRRQRAAARLALPRRHRREGDRPRRPGRRDGDPRRHRSPTPPLETVARQIRVVVMAGEVGPAHAAVQSTTAHRRDLTRHLLVDHGYRRLAFVGTRDGSPDVSSAGRRSSPPTAAAGVDAARRAGASSALQQSDGAIAAGKLLDAAATLRPTPWSAPTTRPRSA